MALHLRALGIKSYSARSLHTLYKFQNQQAMHEFQNGANCSLAPLQEVVDALNMAKGYEDTAMQLLARARNKFQ